MTTKICTKCQQPKPATVAEFGSHINTSDRLGIYCRECVRKYDRERYAANPYPAKARQHLRLYGITLEERDQILRDQGGRCACCGTNDPGKRDWHTDHDHVTNEVRGVLCFRCNTILGSLGDDSSGVALRCAQFLTYLGMEFTLDIR